MQLTEVETVTTGFGVIFTNVVAESDLQTPLLELVSTKVTLPVVISF